jgi:hypothetical protein
MLFSFVCKNYARICVHFSLAGYTLPEMRQFATTTATTNGKRMMTH